MPCYEHLKQRKLKATWFFAFIKSFYVYNLGNKMVSTCNKWCSIMFELDLKYKKVMQIFPASINNEQILLI